eukprot:2084741-Amphidinium_carterae.1
MQQLLLGGVVYPGGLLRDFATCLHGIDDSALPRVRALVFARSFRPCWNSSSARQFHQTLTRRGVVNQQSSCD